MASWVKVEQRDQVAILTIDKPETLNAIDPGVLEELEAAFLTLERHPRMRVVIVTGAGEKAFSAGGDIRAMRDMDPLGGRFFAERGHEVLSRIERSRLISIAAVNGYALGGGTELALACDLRVAAERARLGLPEVTIGLFPGWGGTQRITRLVGAGRGKHLVFTGEQIPAAEALEMGLVNKMVPNAEVIPACLAIAERICRNSQRAVEQAKIAIVNGLEQPLHYGLRLEIESWLVNFATEDRVEGLTAFLEKRPPQWKNR
jgi:enoyl-CoA hydratase